MSSDKNVYYCLVCTKKVKNNGINCDLCGQWVHFKCSKLSSAQIVSLSESIEPYFCFKCLKQEVLFISINNSEFKELYLSNFTPKSFKYPCSVCSNTCKSYQNCVKCDLCDF